MTWFGQGFKDRFLMPSLRGHKCLVILILVQLSFILKIIWTTIFIDRKYYWITNFWYRHFLGSTFSLILNFSLINFFYLKVFWNHSFLELILFGTKMFWPCILSYIFCMLKPKFNNKKPKFLNGYSLVWFSVVVLN